MVLHQCRLCFVGALSEVWDLQWAKTGRFQLYNHGSAAVNRLVYKKPEPPDIAEGYSLLDIPVDVVAGESHSSSFPLLPLHWIWHVSVMVLPQAWSCTCLSRAPLLQSCRAC